MLSTKNLSKKFKKKEALHLVDIDFDNLTYGLLGSNGAGKTTLLRCLCGLYELSEGRITYNGKSIDKNMEYYNNIGYLPQKFDMFHELKLYEMMNYFSIIKKVDRGKSGDEIRKALEEVNLQNYGDKRIGSFSGGMVRRAGIAQALLGNRNILYFDEPTSGLDPEERARFKNIISNIEGNKLIIISTHIVEDIDASCEKVIVLDEGRLLFHGRCSDLKGLANNKVYIIGQEDLNRLGGGYFVLRKFEGSNKIVYRVLSKDSLQQKPEDPTLEDGYMCLVKGIV